MGRKTKIIKFDQFMSGEYKNKIKSFKQIQKGRLFKVVLVSGAVLLLLYTGDVPGATEVLAATDPTDQIEKGAKHIYNILLKVGKWIIIGKGAISTISALMEEDHGRAKRGFLTYLIVYVILHGLPWALGQVDGIFEGINSAPANTEVIYP